MHLRGIWRPEAKAVEVRMRIGGFLCLWHRDHGEFWAPAGEVRLSTGTSFHDIVQRPTPGPLPDHYYPAPPPPPPARVVPQGPRMPSW